MAFGLMSTYIEFWKIPHLLVYMKKISMHQYFRLAQHYFEVQ